MSFKRMELVSEIPDTLDQHIAITDDQGRILWVNEAWKSFSLENGGRPDNTWRNVNYLEVCATSASGGDPDAVEAAAAIRAVISGTLPRFKFEYPCNSPDEERWFLMEVKPLEFEGARHATISHLNITDRRLLGRKQQGVSDQNECQWHGDDTSTNVSVVAGPADLETKNIEELVGKAVVNLLFSKAPTTVLRSVRKATDHFNRAKLLVGVDEEMGVIRLIAAEEELTIAIFELLALNASKLPEHKDFVNQFKNLGAALSYYGVFSQFRRAFVDLSKGFCPYASDGVGSWTARLECEDQKVVLQVYDDKKKLVSSVNPLTLILTPSDQSPNGETDALFADFMAELTAQNKTVDESIRERTSLRDQHLNASEQRMAVLDETLEVLIETTFAQSIGDLLWTLAVLLSDVPSWEGYSLVRKSISLYRRVLKEGGVLN